MVEGLKRKTISGIFWSGIERFSLQGVQFVINIIMARLLLPSDYGMIGMLAVFMQISQSFIDCGFTSALIQKQDRNEVDFSTVYYFNIFIAILLYGIIFFAAPGIAHFYHMPALIPVTRVVALNLVIASFSAVHKTKLTIHIDFKTQSKISLTAALVSGVIGVVMAYYGWGVWSLVGQSVLNTLLLTVLFHIVLKWKPLKVFSSASFRRLFSFGSKLLISGLIHTVYYNLYSLVIGRKFSASELGYYTRAEQFAMFLSSNLNGVIMRVTFPIMSTIQDDDERLALVYRKYIRMSSFWIFPLMVGLAVLAKPLIVLLLTDKWLSVVGLLQILCFDWMFDHLSIINLNLLHVKGRSDLSLRLEIVKKIIAVGILLISMSWGIVAMCWGRVLYSLIAVCLNSYYTNYLIGLSLKKQLVDVLPYLGLSLGMGGFVWLVIPYFSSEIWTLVIGFLTGALFYLGSAWLLKMKTLKEFLLLINH